ncbi:hypothetical protein ASPVEDRAFT_651446 [Aspergillus versicolor CBS 583.65]|uniref:Uncharacterized protein n=1 Tax=Aspergillus versicolor CBS 583.65 TaxID=1036611 RepID=A0A1L9PK03_ASPVE|nr:uncharacterized protein ASPVEDRAFT_651446 [Aspergillus versicolor CBS 583.65]OJJ01813.1 hypothetical protein ASPVEDRAFT_651446 [Aspergillus versicolor CBS 583.65]
MRPWSSRICLLQSTMSSRVSHEMTFRRKTDRQNKSSSIRVRTGPALFSTREAGQSSQQVLVSTSKDQGARPMADKCYRMKRDAHAGHTCKVGWLAIIPTGYRARREKKPQSPNQAPALPHGDPAWVGRVPRLLRTAMSDLIKYRSDKAGRIR